MLLEASGVDKRFSGLQALKNAWIRVEPAEIVALVGPNGSGKSTLLNVLSGFLKPDSGEIQFEGSRITGLPPHRIGRRGIRRTFQLPSQPQDMTVLEVMLCGAPLLVGQSAIASMLRPRRAAKEQAEAVVRAQKLLADLKLGGMEQHAAGALSGGQQKLLSLGAVLMSDPKLLLLDEPTAGVNPTLRKTMIRDLSALRDRGITLLIVEHDMEFIGALCDRVFVLDKGSVIAECRPDELRSDPRVIEAYLGSAPVGDTVEAKASQESGS